MSTLASQVRAMPPLILFPREFWALLEYSRSLPTGTPLGKTWRCNLFCDPGWIVGRYERYSVVDGREVVEIGWYDPVVIPAGTVLQDMGGWWKGTLPCGETISATDRQFVARELRRGKP